jgi:allantoinase
MTGDVRMRDFVGYGPSPPNARWPTGARVALQFVVNYEEGAERCVLDGDESAETHLGETVGLSAPAGRRWLSQESIFEFGSRVGIWRLMQLFGERQLPFTLFGVGLALERNPAVAEKAADLGCDFAGHGYRWIDYVEVDRETERAHIARTVDVIARLTGNPPSGWYTGRASENTRSIIREMGCFLYDSDSYCDELPYWIGDHLVIPYAFDTNDQRFSAYNAFATGDHFGSYLRAALDFLLKEGVHQPRMMSVGLHPRLVGRPGRAAALASFLDYAMNCESLWICRREDIAHHWKTIHPPTLQPSIRTN